MWVPLKEKEKEKKTKSKPQMTDGRESIHMQREFSIFLVFIFQIFFLRFTKIWPSDFVGQRMKSALCDEGYAWVPKTQDFTENSGKNSENPKFLVFLRFTMF